ncbi:pseudouridine synthase [Simkania sp.]|uniref:pseudouridine synthase n=1 Tax=Simkania sp. TaxID=34094 RepID=UPI003B5238A8
MDEERVSKLMARRGLCSRREAEQYMAEGRVKVNGMLITEQGTKVPVDAKITLDQAGLQRVTIAVNKPLGYVSNLPQENYPEAKELILPENRFGKGPPVDPKSLHVVGRLDVNSKGLLLFSSDGRVAKKIIGPDSEVEKEYIIRFQDPVPEKVIQKLRFGLKLDGKPLKRARVKRAGDRALTMVLREGRNRQIRRMCELVDLRVTSLKRVRIGNIQLGSLPVGQWMVVR